MYIKSKRTSKFDSVSEEIMVGTKFKVSTLIDIYDLRCTLSSFSPLIFFHSESEGLDGVDWDWEQPTKASDFGNYFKLIQGAFEEFAGNIRMSVDVHPGRFLPPSISKYVDHIHLLAYDNPDKTAGHHSTLSYVRKSVQTLESHGFPKSKIVLGIPICSKWSASPSDTYLFATFR